MWIAAKRAGRVLPALFALLSLALVVWAGPLQDADVRYRAGDYQGALALLQQARQQEPNDPHVYAALGKTYRRLGDDAGALKAYDEVLRLDPSLNSIQDKQGFLNAYRSLGGQRSPSANTGASSGQRADASDIINALTSGDVYVVPGMRNQVDENALAAAAAKARPTIVKVLTVATLGGYPNREALASDLRKRLNLSDDAVMLVATPRGISGSSGRLSNAQIEESFQKAGVDRALAQGGLTGAIATAIQSLSGTVVSDRRTDTGRGAGVLFLALAGIGGFVGYRAYKKGKEMSDAKGPVEEQRQKVLENLSYADGYLDVLPKGDDADKARELRASAYEKYDTATGLMNAAKTPDDFRRAAPLLDQALEEMVECRRAIDRATGGTGVAMGLIDIPSLATTGAKAERFKKTEEVRSIEERARLQRDIESIPTDQRGVSFFSGQPVPASELVPVTLVVQGQKRTVLATREEAAALARGETPTIRAFRDDTGRPVPWYEYRGYDPYRDYYMNPPLLSASDLISLYVLSSLLGPQVYYGYGPWGYGGFGWGMPFPSGGFGWGGWGAGYGGFGGYNGGYSGYGDNGPGSQPSYEPDHAGGIDFFGSGYNEQGGGFDVGSGDSGDSGGFDFGGGDIGGGDFGGGGDW
jgi:tetratricopeptide (TPR) repeat protein